MCNWLSCVRVGAGHFPIILMLLMVVTLALTYIWAIFRQDVDSYFPYISDAASKRPESCLFGQLLNYGAFLGVIIIYLRYRLVKELNRGSDLVLNRLNLAALIFGCMSAFGMTIVANFQITAVFYVHLIGAFTCFGAGLIYSILQTAASYRMCPLYNGITVCRMRLFISVLALVAFLTTIITGSLALAARHWHNLNDNDDPDRIMNELYRIKKTDPGYYLHICSAVCEWFLSFSFMVFLMTYSKDFEKIRITMAVEPLVAHLDESPPNAPSLEARNLLNVN